MVKAQVLVGGRGKAGGIKSAEDAGGGGGARARHPGHGHRRSHRAPAVDRAARRTSQREYYFSITFDRGAKRPLLMLTTAGGMEIEEVAARRPSRSRGCTSTR